MSDHEFSDEVRRYAAEVVRRQDEAIEEMAERILLSGTNWGMKVYKWIANGSAHIVVEPTPETRGIMFVYEAPTEAMPDWRVCPNEECDGGWVRHYSQVVGEDPRHCPVCDGKGWVRP